MEGIGRPLRAAPGMSPRRQASCEDTAHGTARRTHLKRTNRNKSLSGMRQTKKRNEINRARATTGMVFCRLTLGGV